MYYNLLPSKIIIRLPCGENLAQPGSVPDLGSVFLPGEVCLVAARLR